MNSGNSPRSARLKFSLRHLIILTTLIAVGIAVVMVHRKNRLLHQQREQLLSLSSRLIVDNEDELTLAAMPRVADDFLSWRVHVPENDDYELRLGAGDISEQGVPPIVDKVRILAGQHRVTLQSGDSPDEEFQYVVYVDGEQVISVKMGQDWIPGGWSSSHGMGWPRQSASSSSPLQLAARSYRAKPDFGKRNYFNGNSDNYVTRLGYRLWIDSADQTYQPPSPLMVPPFDPLHQGIGLRDGLRYTMSNRPPYHWTFTRPSLATNDPMLRIVAEFFDGEKSVLSDRTQSFASWQIRDAASGSATQRWENESTKQTLTAFLHASLGPKAEYQPVVELKWDASRPDEVGLRLANTPANDRITRWRLRILGGLEHLWREIEIGEHSVTLGELMSEAPVEPNENLISLNISDGTESEIAIRWQTNETLPLQIVQRTKQQYASMQLNRGLPSSFGMKLPRSITENVSAQTSDRHPNLSIPLPGGPVVQQLVIELERGSREWVWFEVGPHRSLGDHPL
ncbi:hypothetical protein [Rhodopirellula europaea]|uniref:Uncharacterized protein n=1 Tax=Rhodopirellula europaea 6C TaxID=1263867 RepID=M2B139_9BACT|nr:hypothetical protein [Rhodopirellula europaea]EMB15944.1 hypothetical protein RE6C_03291 [Rhodopirellula europaea 6C]